MKLNNFCILPTNYGNFYMYDTGNDNVRLISYTLLSNIRKNPLLRIHSSCIASEVFGARDCDCADQLREAMKLISSEENGLIIHINQEGRGLGLSKKIKAVSLMQRIHCDTVESFEQLGFALDSRCYGDAIKLLDFLGIISVRLISNNPRKKDYLEKNGINVEIVHTHPQIRPENKDYLYSKNKKLGHSLPLDSNNENEVIRFYHSDLQWGEFSNFSSHAIFLDKKIWKTVEHYYQSQKFKGTEFEELIRIQSSPMMAKQKAHEILKINPIQNWNTKKISVMRKGLKAKFVQHPELKELLISTGKRILIERSDVDYFWGDGKDGSGKNCLGRLLMELRDEFKRFDGKL